MEKDLEGALLRNLILKTKIVIVFFLAVFLLQMTGIYIFFSKGVITDFSLMKVAAIPVFIGLVVIDELIILRFLTQVVDGRRKYRPFWIYMGAVAEITYPTMVLAYAGEIFSTILDGMSIFMFLNSPPLLIYVIFIVLSSLYFNFRLSVLIGVLASIQYILVSAWFLPVETSGMELMVNISKGIFFIPCGIIAGFVSNKIKEAITESLKAKNTLINELDNKVSERTLEIEKQKDILQEKNKEITDSINYAQRIQEAILPSSRLVKEYLPQSFIFYRPKDIVAGDFYWMESPPQPLLNPPRRGGLSPTPTGKLAGACYFAAADCTGHGVPGAMVSVVCHNALNRAVREFRLTDPGLILDKTRELVIETFEKSDHEVKDGMDISLCVLSPPSSGKAGEWFLQWAGANNPLWIINPDRKSWPANSLPFGDVQGGAEIKADKQPIGKFDELRPYTSHTIELQRGDTIYIFTDGYPDQFGGPRGKKYKYNTLKNKLLEISGHSLEEQHQLLEQEFDNWISWPGQNGIKQEFEQVDDVCIIGVRL